MGTQITARTVMFILSARSLTYPYSEMIAAFYTKAKAQERLAKEHGTGRWKELWIEETYVDD